MQTLNQNRKLRGLLVGGAGHQGQEYHKILKPYVEWVCIIDQNTETLEELYKSESSQLTSQIPNKLNKTGYDFALVALPHHQHFEVCERLLAAGIPTIKEKPLARDPTELEEYKVILSRSTAQLFTIVQREFHPYYRRAFENLSEMGRIYSFKFEYFMNLEMPTSGWRSSLEKSGGGVVIDMGYHALDIIHRFFGVPSKIQSSINYCFEQTRHSHLEDSALINFKYSTAGLHGELHLERHSFEKRERLEIFGENGAIVVTPNSYTAYNRQGEIIDQTQEVIIKSSVLLKMFDFHLTNIENPLEYQKHIKNHSQIVKTIDQIYLERETNINHQVMMQLVNSVNKTAY